MDWIKKNKRIVIGVLVVVVLACISVGAYLVSGNGEPKNANKENAEKTVEKQEDSEEVQDEEKVTENVDTETVVDDTTQTETDEVAEETTETTQPSTSANDTTSNNNNTTNNNTISGNTTSSNSTSNNSTNSGSTTNNNTNSGSTTNNGSANGTGNKTQSTSGKQLSPAQIAAVNAGYYKVVTSSEGYSVMVHDGEYEKGMKILEDYLATLGYERIGGSGSWIDNSCDQYGVYVDYNEIKEIQTEDNIVWD